MRILWCITLNHRERALKEEFQQPQQSKWLLRVSTLSKSCT